MTNLPQSILTAPLGGVAGPTVPSMEQRMAERIRPDRKAVMFQRWENLAFAHWAFDAEIIQRSLPFGLTVDRFEGNAWVGIVPIFMRGVRPRFTPPIPFVSDFLELNLRTYVHDPTGRPGVYFYSLSCDQSLVVEMARRFVGLNYRHAEMEGDRGLDGIVKMKIQRTEASNVETFQYQAEGEAFHRAEADSLEFFLIERYRLYCLHEDVLRTIQVHHTPYELRPARLEKWCGREFAVAGLPAPARDPDHVCAANSVDLEVFLPETVQR